MEFLSNFIKFFMGRPLETQLLLSIVFLLLLTYFLGSCVFPLIFNYRIIPRIEVRLGKNLQRWGVTTEMLVFGKFQMKNLILAIWVLHQYLIVNFSKDPDLAIKRFNQRSAHTLDLAKANYDIREATQFEIFMSFLALANLFLSLLLIIAILFFKK